MKAKPFLLTAAGIAGAAWLAFGPNLTGQSPAPSDDLTPLIQVVEAQQKLVLANQEKIDSRLAAVAEDLRVGFIFVSRGGKK